MPSPKDLGLPLEKWREGQYELVTRAAEATKTLIIQAPPGTGKSALAVGAARLSHQKTIILTATKSLQTQYTTQFRGMVHSLYGRANYPCVLDTFDNYTAADLGAVGVRCDDAPCGVGYQCSWVDRCPYFMERDKFLGADIGVTNYSYFLQSPMKCDLVVCDEGHLFDKVLGKEVRLPYDHIPEDIDNLLLESRKEMYRSMVESRPNGREYRAYAKTLESIEQAISLLAKPTGKVFALEGGQLVIKEVWGQWESGARTVIMSGTLEPVELFAKFYGIRDYEFVDVPWTFKADRRPLYYRPVTHVSGQRVGEVAPRLARMVDWELGRRGGEKGLIHSVSYELGEAVWGLMRRQDRVLLHRRGDRREEVVAKFRTMERDVWLMSPSMGVGEDFPYDAARSQIILKLPFPNLGDPLVQARRRQYPEWYLYSTAQALWQMYGRVMRSEDDAGETVLLDENYDMIVKAGLVPSGIQAAIR